MKILYIITQHSLTTKEEDLKKTFDSLPKTCTKVLATYSNEISEESAINNQVQNQIEGDFSHYCIIPAGSTLSDNYLELISKYVDDKSAIYMPIVNYCYDESGEEIFKGFLNTIAWKPHIARELGVLTLDLSIKQADTTLYGALIASSILKTNKLNEEIKYFSQFEYLNRVIKSETKVFFIPKVLVTLNKDFELKSIDKEEKIKYFNEARKGY